MLKQYLCDSCGLKIKMDYEFERLSAFCPKCGEDDITLITGNCLCCVHLKVFEEFNVPYGESTAIHPETSICSLGECAIGCTEYEVE